MILSDSSKRFQSGQEHFSSMISYWLHQSDFSLRQFCAIADWATGEKNVIGSGPLSHVTRGNFQKISIRYLDIFSCVNKTIWTWKQQGKEEVIQQFGPPSRFNVPKPTYLFENAIWLYQIDDKTSEMRLLDIRDFVFILAGYMRLPYVESKLTPYEGKIMSHELSELLNNLISGLQTSLKARVDFLVSCHPEPSPSLRSLICQLLLDGIELETNELQKQLPSFAEMIRVARNIPKGLYGVSELRAELLTKRTRS